MITIAWITTLLLFIVVGCVLAYSIFLRSKGSESLKIFVSGFKESFKKSGFNPATKKYPVELYKWIICEECLECDECLDRASWDPMDIADWIKEGLPGTPEADTECQDYCQCRLIVVRKKVGSGS